MPREKIFMSYFIVDIDGTPSGLTQTNLTDDNPSHETYAKIMEQFNNLMIQRKASSGKLEIIID